MQPSDVYAWLTARPNLGCDGFDYHITASILALSLWEAETGGLSVPDAVGLDGDELADLASEMFPHTTAVFARLRGRECSPPAEDEVCLRDLLCRSVTDGTKLQVPTGRYGRAALHAAKPPLAGSGFSEPSRTWWLMTRHFESLAARNRADMKWKKFFYRTICRDDGYMLCAAPSCAECDDFDNCFAEETGESLLAQARRTVERTAA